MAPSVLGVWCQPAKQPSSTSAHTGSPYTARAGLGEVGPSDLLGSRPDSRRQNKTPKVLWERPSTPRPALSPLQGDMDRVSGRDSLCIRTREAVGTPGGSRLAP